MLAAQWSEKQRRSIWIIFFWNKYCLFAGCLTSQQHASVSQGRICLDNFMCCHTVIEVADQTFYLAQSQCTDTGLTTPSTDPITPGAWQGSHWSANFKSLVWLDLEKSRRKRDSNPGSSALEADALTTRPTRWSWNLYAAEWTWGTCWTLLEAQEIFFLNVSLLISWKKRQRRQREVKLC